MIFHSTLPFWHTIAIFVVASSSSDGLLFRFSGSVCTPRFLRSSHFAAIDACYCCAGFLKRGDCIARFFRCFKRGDVCTPRFLRCSQGFREFLNSAVPPVQKPNSQGSLYGLCATMMGFHSKCFVFGMICAVFSVLG